MQRGGGTARANVAATPEALGTLLPNNMESGSSTAPTGTGPSLESLVDVIRNGQPGVTGTTPSAKPKPKAKSKNKKAKLEEAKTP